ncbi:hypothetical protein TIFTF001_016045 [Ficus carica]|uniref:Longin domain-containing protein n=1 Tax=Ficus carica TaxID=3494 RepID=A0AA88D8E3_FICCA|nr:hypothetical protein TIFTF001_016045 [Ficus carica]
MKLHYCPFLLCLWRLRVSGVSHLHLQRDNIVAVARLRLMQPRGCDSHLGLCEFLDCEISLLDHEISVEIQSSSRSSLRRRYLHKLRQISVAISIGGRRSPSHRRKTSIYHDLVRGSDRDDRSSPTTGSLSSPMVAWKWWQRSENQMLTITIGFCGFMAGERVSRDYCLGWRPDKALQEAGDLARDSRSSTAIVQLPQQWRLIFSAVTGNTGAVARRILEKLPSEADSRLCFSQDRYIFHILRIDGLDFLCMANDTFGMSVGRSFLFLESILVETGAVHDITHYGRVRRGITCKHEFCYFL